MTQRRNRRNDAILHSKRVSVLGMGRSGLSCAKLLQRQGAEVFVSDSADGKRLIPQIRQLRAANLKFEYGKHTQKVIERKDFIVVSPGIPLQIPILKKAFRLKIPVFSEIEVAWWFRPAQTKIIAVTGTNGKTTVVSLIGEILKNAGKKVSVAGNIGLPLAEVVEDPAAEVVVVEVSSFQLKTIKDFRPWISAILNITPDHLEWHRTMRDYRGAKAKIFANQTEQDFLILNADDRECRKLAETARSKVIFFSRRRELKEGVFVKGNDIVSTVKSLEFRVESLELKIPGLCNLENVLAAVCVGLIWGVSPRVMKETIENFKGLPHRLELVREEKGVRFINDSKATNVGSTRAALESFPAPIILIMGGRGKGSSYRRLRKLVQQKVKALFVLGEARSKIKNQLSGTTTIYEVNDVESAVKGAWKVAQAEDWVLFSPGCASFDQFKNYQQRGKFFKKMVRKYAKPTT